mgnify:CR=1 FL=1
MEARIAPIKRTLAKPEPATTVATPSLPKGTSREFARMALAAVASGVVFGLVSGLVVYLVASHPQLEPGPLAHTDNTVSASPAR